MEKLILILLLNSPDQSTKIIDRIPMESQWHCIQQVSDYLNNPANPIVYQDELGPVFKWAGYCLSEKESKYLIFEK